MGDPFFSGPNTATTYVEVDSLNENDSSPLSGKIWPCRRNKCSHADSDAVTVRAEAAVGGAMEVLSMLLRHGASKVINKQDTHGRT